MKKHIKIMCFVLLALMILSVSAKESDNKLYFTGSGDRLYYDTKLFDSDVFMHHIDMVPGSEYTDKLLVENGSSVDYDLYLKIKEVEQDSELDELLDNILMEIYLDDELLYEGKVKGLDYNNSGVNLKDAIHIGKYLKNTEQELIVKTKLDEDYNNPNIDDEAHIEWEFYATYVDEDKDVPVIDEGNKYEPIPLLPNTGDKIIMYVVMAIVSGGLLILLLVGLLKSKSNKKVKKH